MAETQQDTSVEILPDAMAKIQLETIEEVEFKASEEIQPQMVQKFQSPMTEEIQPRKNEDIQPKIVEARFQFRFQVCYLQASVCVHSVRAHIRLSASDVLEKKLLF